MPPLTANGARFQVRWLEPAIGNDDGDPASRMAPVVFVHGLVMDNLSSFYYTLAGPVTAAGARVLLYDLRGHGGSERAPHGYATRDQALDLLGLLDASGVTEPVHLVANSFGGLIAARAALAAPDRVAGLALLETCVAGAPAAAWLEGMINNTSANALVFEYHRTSDVFGAAGQRKAARMAQSADGLLNGTSLIEDLIAERPLTAAELEAIRCPVLAVFGERSDLAASAAELRDHLPRGEVAMIPGLTHTVLRDAPKTVCGILLDWLARQAPVGIGSTQ